jgi:hypothetical protein
MGDRRVRVCAGVTMSVTGCALGLTTINLAAPETTSLSWFLVGAIDAFAVSSFASLMTIIELARKTRDSEGVVRDAAAMIAHAIAEELQDLGFDAEVIVTRDGFAIHNRDNGSVH